MMKIRTKASHAEGMRQTIIRAIRGMHERNIRAQQERARALAMPPAASTIDEDLLFSGRNRPGRKSPIHA